MVDPMEIALPVKSRILFVGVGESEVPAFEYIARALESEGHTCRAVTWLPRLSSPATEALERHVPDSRVVDSQLHRVFAAQGLAAPSMAADYDRDWHFASTQAKTRHVTRVYQALLDVHTDFGPDLVVSSVGGETTRVVSEIVAKTAGTPAAYFNAVPIPGRFALLRSLEAPFVPYPGADTSFRPQRNVIANSVEQNGKNGQSAQQSSPSEGFSRLWAQTVGREKTYPKSWIPRKVGSVVRQAILSRVKAKSEQFDQKHVKVLYPLHDERDFQVAVRERHAVPQINLLSYVSSELPPNFHLYVKPHPEHLTMHHTLLWRDLLKRPNVHFLPWDIPASHAIENADVVFTLASSMGFEAIQAGKPVVCYGRPFYSDRRMSFDVGDPRLIADTIKSAVGSKPDPAALKSLIELMTDWSWPGNFTPLNLNESNLEQLTAGVRNVVEQL